MAKIENIILPQNYKLKENIELHIQVIQHSDGHYLLVLNVFEKDNSTIEINSFELDLTLTPNIFPRDIKVNFKDMIWNAFAHQNHMEGIFEYFFMELVKKDRIMLEIEYRDEIFPNFRVYLMMDNYINEVEIPKKEATFLE